MDNIADCCWDLFPWISTQATHLGLETRDNRFARLGGELLILAQHVTFSRQTRPNPRLWEILQLVDRACSPPRHRHIHGRQHPFDTLRTILDCIDTESPAEKAMMTSVQDGLRQFVLHNPEFPILLRAIEHCINKQEEIEPLETLPHRQTHIQNTHQKHSTRVANSLYTQLRLYSTCSCDTRHLEVARLRLNPHQRETDTENMQFEVLFLASSEWARDPYCQSSVCWKEARVLVARRDDSRRIKRVSFQAKSSFATRKVQQCTPPSASLRSIGLGEFCSLLRSQLDKRIYFHIQNNVLKIASTTIQESTPPPTVLPLASTPLADWLEQTSQLPNRIKVTLAYTIAKSMWQFYNSYWARIPWTHDNIHLLKERVTEGVLHTRTQPYFITKLHKFTVPEQDFLITDDALHCYPNILSLGIILIEIATQQSFRPDSLSIQWNESTVNDYFEWGLMTANSGILTARIGAHYEKVVNNCLDSDIFKSISEDDCLDPAALEKHIETRQSLLFDKVVLPLHELYYAYRDDWYLQESIPPIPTRDQAMKSKSAQAAAAFPQLQDEDQPTVAIFCALPLEADAVIELLDSTRGELKISRKVVGDENTYTFGRISSLNVVLIHMGGIGKGSAVHAASSLRASYPGVNLALVVGICGGVPGERENGELILGDVVISDGIVQYDFGRQYPDAYMAQSGSEVLGPPSIKLRGILAMLKGIRSRGRMESKIRSYLRVLRDRLGAKRTVYPGIARDTLFRPTYHHKHHTSSCTVCSKGPDSVCTEARTQTCQQLGCEEMFLVPRTRLQESSIENGHPPPSPNIHFGLVGSGDTVMKSGQHRDQIATQHNLIAFEMEGSGVWDFFPCLIIKGVCDYADSHKSQHWQSYAAATAAACMRAFLEEWESVH